MTRTLVVLAMLIAACGGSEAPTAQRINLCTGPAIFPVAECGAAGRRCVNLDQGVQGVAQIYCATYPGNPEGDLAFWRVVRNEHADCGIGTDSCTAATSDGCAIEITCPDRRTP
jgi:hypothetical protein